MNNTLKRLVILLHLMVSISILSFGQGFRNVGYAGANFLKIPVEPAGAALANSSVASVQGVAGLYWNPAAIAFTEGTEILLSRVSWLADTRVSFVGIAQNLGPGTIGVSLTALSMDDMEITTETEPDGTGSNFGAGSYAIGVSYGMKIIDRFSFGGTIKYIYEYIWETNGSTYAFDFGSVYSTDFHNLRIGMRLANFGANTTFAGTPIDEKPGTIAQSGISYSYDPRLERVSNKYPLPQLFNVGIAIDPLRTEDHRITLTAGANDPNDNSTQLVFGGEYAWQELLILRAGYKSGYDEQDISLGLGLNVNLGGVQSRLDFAHATFGRLGGTSFLGLRIEL
jgi:hypothetical protein